MTTASFLNELLKRVNSAYGKTQKENGKPRLWQLLCGEKIAQGDRLLSVHDSVWL